MRVRASDRRVVRDRANGRCEYCLMAENWEPYFTYHTEHIVARQHGGSDSLENLAFSCNHCNLLKGPNLASIDPDSGGLTPLFHPRTHVWAEHFRVEHGRIHGTTPIGRTTVFLHQMNATHRIELRTENGDLF